MKSLGALFCIAIVAMGCVAQPEEVDTLDTGIDDAMEVDPTMMACNYGDCMEFCRADGGTFKNCHPVCNADCNA